MVKPWGCANKKPAKGFWARDGLFHFRMFGLILSVYRMRWVPFVMSTACHYDKIDEDARCAGCTRERLK